MRDEGEKEAWRRERKQASYKNAGRGVYSVMKHSLRSVLLVLWLLVAAFCLGMLGHFKLTSQVRWALPKKDRLPKND
jgi:hypothetical protein